MKPAAWLAIPIVSLLLAQSACGVKGPPLPPIPDTPQASENLPGARPSPSPSLQNKKRKAAGP